MEGPFSTELERWLSDGTPKTFGDLSTAFGDKGFAVTVLLLMSVPALPVPTGGVTHVLEAVAIVVAAQMVAGRRTMWLPRRVRGRPLGTILTGRAIPFLVARIRWLERHSHPHFSSAFHHGWALRAVGAVLIVFAAAAALAPPFSGLDTLPAIGAVLVTLAVLLEDLAVLAAGIVVGVAGIVLMASVGAAVVHLVGDLL